MRTFQGSKTKIIRYSKIVEPSLKKFRIDQWYFNPRGSAKSHYLGPHSSSVVATEGRHK